MAFNWCSLAVAFTRRRCRSTLPLFSDGLSVGNQFRILVGRKSLCTSAINEVEAVDFRNASFLNAVVKVYCNHAEPEYSHPWRKQEHYNTSSSAFMIANGKLLTNAHCIKHNTLILVKKRGSTISYVAQVLAIGVECNLALLSVESEKFWKGIQPLKFGPLPNLLDKITVVGYPLGGETISLSKSIVSNIEVTSYGHGSKLPVIQIDAAINPGNYSGGPALNHQGECIGVTFQVDRSRKLQNIGYVIPTEVVNHFLQDYKMNGKYTGFPSLGVSFQTMENAALRACLNVPSDEGVLVIKVEPTSPASYVLKERDIIVSVDNIAVGCEGMVPFCSSERIAVDYLISKKFTGDIAELGIIRDEQHMKVELALHAKVPHHINGDQPSYLIVGGLVFTPLAQPLKEEEDIELKLLTKAKYARSNFKGEQIVILSQILSNEVNMGYEDMSNKQVLKLNETCIRNIHHLARLVDSCKDKYLVFELEDNDLLVLERESALASSNSIRKAYGIRSERSDDLLHHDSSIYNL